MGTGNNLINYKRLYHWFHAEQRDLPWRHNRSPFAVWVSEMMLQQTQVAVVIPYFERWMQRFPDIETLAKAPLDEVIKLWEGLGYYSRARYLHAGAKHILQYHQGVFPDSPEALAKIKGLGPYTSGAIRSFAFHHRVPAIDGNGVRVLTRYFGIRDDISKPATMRQLWLLAEKCLPEEEPWVFNEALIELGATRCTKQPKCSQCPLKQGCQAFANGTTTEIPYKSAKIKSEPLYRSVAVIQWIDKILVRRGQQGEIMSDLHEFPYFETGEKGFSSQKLQKEVEKWLKCKMGEGSEMPEVSHSFTRYRVRLRPIKFVCTSSHIPSVSHPYSWQDLSSLKKIAFSSGHRRVLHSI